MLFIVLMFYDYFKSKIKLGILKKKLYKLIKLVTKNIVIQHQYKKLLINF